MTLKENLMKGYTGEAVWSARHPKTGKRLAVMAYSGHWSDCPYWLGVIHGLHPQFVVDVEFVKRHSYTALGVVYWELPDGPIYFRTGEKKVPGSKKTFFIGAQDRVTQVADSEPVSLFQTLVPA